MAQALSGAAGRSAAGLRLDPACQTAAEVEPRYGHGERESHDDGSENRDACQRSEEHTSELQSLRHLVCRLLLEKKKKSNDYTGPPWVRVEGRIAEVAQHAR